MRLLRVFLAHELATQIRSARFHGMTFAYLLVATAPAVAAYFVGSRGGAVIGATLYAELMDTFQPFATTLFAAVLAVDIVSRERDENSLAVASMAPVSATGYVLRRWSALLLLLVPITLVPRAIAMALLAHADRAMPDAAPLLFGWLVHIAPLLIVVSAFSTALGTISGRTVLALLLGGGLFTIGLGIANDLLAYTHRQIDSPAAFFGLNKAFARSLQWQFLNMSIPSAAGYPLAQEIERTTVQGALAAGVAALSIGLSCSYLRRTKRDLRPWRISEQHPLRSFLRIANRMREELAPDGALEIPERVALALGLLTSIVALVLLAQRHDAFERLAAERYAAETTGVAPMPAAIVPSSASMRGRITRGGVLEATATLTMRNDGPAPQRDLAFALNRGIVIERVQPSRGSASVQRVWERVGVTLDPPLAPRESRSIAFALRGAPGIHEIALPGARSLGARWRRYANATRSFDMADLSQSMIYRAATAQGMVLEGPQLLPVPRYSPWNVVAYEPWENPDGSDELFTRERVTPPAALSIDLAVADDFLAIDACGTAARGRIASRCTSALGDYILVAARYDTTSLPGGITLAHLPVHARLAQAHAPALAGAIETARQSWPSFALPPGAMFVERAAFPGERYYGEWNRTAAMRALASHGPLNLIPEPMFIRTRPLDRSMLAAALIANALQSRRAVASEEQAFFREFYETIASWRTGGPKPNAVETGPMHPITDPIVAESRYIRGTPRLSKVLADIEYRVGAERLIEAVEEFTSQWRTGTARELLATIGRHGGVDLGRVYDDYFIGTALPRLTLDGVTFTRAGDAWEVRGSVKNEGTGEVFCPVVLRSAAGSARTIVRVDSASATPFVLRTAHVPRTVQLDPERVVYRFAAVGTIQFVDHEEKE